MANNNDWALILGASSGFGEAVAIKLAQEGFNVFGVHLDRKSAKGHIDEIIGKHRKCRPARAVFFNVNASAEDKRQMVLDRIADEVGSERPG